MLLLRVWDLVGVSAARIGVDVCPWNQTRAKLIIPVNASSLRTALSKVNAAMRLALVKSPRRIGPWGETAVPAAHVLKAAEISLLRRVVEAHCTKYGIRTSEGKKSVARSVMVHFRKDITEEKLLKILDLEDNPVAVSGRSFPLHRRGQTLDGEAGIIATNQM